MPISFQRPGRCFPGIMSAGHRGVKAARATLGPMARPPDELGAHMSIAGGLYRALERGRALDCGAVQLFLRNQRQWHARPMTDAEVRAFHAARRQTGIRHVFAHASYLINLGAPDDAAWRRAVDAFTDELERAERLDLSCVVVHPGSHLGAGVASGLARVVAALDEVTRRTPGYTVRIALENTAGAGHSIGRGYLGRLPFRRLLRDRRFRQVPKVLETPKEPEPVADRRNLALLRALRRRG